ncbi:MAG TPA: hypothetical protein VKU85_15345, partial [bacterium]|nr:hypothetical protein [bacterium]
GGPDPEGSFVRGSVLASDIGGRGPADSEARRAPKRQGVPSISGLIDEDRLPVLLLQPWSG